jgi:choline-sulfatase
MTSDIYPADYGWAVNWDELEVRPSWYHNMSSVLQAGPSVRTNQLDHDEETIFRARQYLYDHVRNHPDEPFCLTVSMTHPHDPYTIPAEFYDLYRDEDIPMPQNTLAQAEQDAHSQRLLKVIDLWDKPLSDEAIRRARRAYFGSCSYVDAKIGELLKTLRECELADDTIIVFSGDHGDMLGDRGLWYKMHWFEMAARVPLIVHAPARYASARVSQHVSTLDLLPTFVDMAGAQIDTRLPMDGRSLVPQLRGQSGTDEAFGEYMAEGSKTPLVMIRRGPWKFIYSQDNVCMLYHLPQDPQERHNLADDPAHAATVQAFLSETLQRWDLPELHQSVLNSQRRRRLVYSALTKGRLTSWDHQPWVDASQQYMRNHIDLDDLGRCRGPPVRIEHLQRLTRLLALLAHALGFAVFREALRFVRGVLLVEALLLLLLAQELVVLIHAQRRSFLAVANAMSCTLQIHSSGGSPSHGSMGYTQGMAVFSLNVSPQQNAMRKKTRMPASEITPQLSAFAMVWWMASRSWRSLRGWVRSAKGPRDSSNITCWRRLSRVTCSDSSCSEVKDSMRDCDGLFA